MKIVFLLTLICLTLGSCSVLVETSTIKCMKVKKTKVHLTSESKYWTNHLRLKKGGYYTYYSNFLAMRFGTIRGTYTIDGNDIHFFSCNNDSLPGSLSGRGIIDPESGKIILPSTDSAWNRTIYVKKGDLKRLK